jgi:tetratricopeptide (TPR) repeat protein
MMTVSTANQVEFSLACLCGAGSTCDCYASKERLVAHQATTRRAAFVAAASGRLPQALELLKNTLASEPRDGVSWLLLGLIEFQTGNLPEARSSWTRALELDGSCDAGRWLEDLRAGPTHDALRGYNDAIALVNGGEVRQAERLLDRVRRQLPDFAPAAHLEDLIQSTIAEEKGEPNRAGRRRRRLDQIIGIQVSPVGALMLIVLLAAAYKFGVTRQNASPVLSPSVLPQVSQTAQVAPAGPNAPPAPHVVPIYINGWQRFRAAREASQTGDWSRVVEFLAQFGSVPKSAFYHDDGLYLLAQGYAHLHDDQRSAQIANELLQEHPTSIFANSVIRRLAGRTPDR